MILTLLLSVLFSIVHAEADVPVNMTPFVHQTATYYSSDTVTMGGIGFGTGLKFTYGQNLVAQTDANVLWLNGNAVSTRFAMGYKRNGWWSPAIFGAYNLLWGQRTEILTETGRRPAVPVWVLGLRASPLQFIGSYGIVSALEFGFGFGPDNGRNYELTILSADIYW